MVPRSTLWWVFTVNTYLWVGMVLTVTCLRRRKGKQNDSKDLLKMSSLKRYVGNRQLETVCYK